MPGGKTSAGPNTWGAVRGAPGRGYTSAMARAARRTGNLPAETSSFIGRRRELAEIRKKLAASRLVTLTGPGGVGKTRLAVRAAAARGFRDGVILVELAEARDGGAVAGAAVAALDLRDQAPAGPLPLLLSGRLEDCSLGPRRSPNWTLTTTGRCSRTRRASCGSPRCAGSPSPGSLPRGGCWRAWPGSRTLRSWTSPGWSWRSCRKRWPACPGCGSSTSAATRCAPCPAGPAA